MSAIMPYTKNLEDDHPETFRLVMDALKNYSRIGLSLSSVNCYVKAMLGQKAGSDLQLKEFVTSALRRAVELGFAKQLKNGTYVIRSGADAKLPSGPADFQMYYRPAQSNSYIPVPAPPNYPASSKAFVASKPGGSRTNNPEPERCQYSPLPEGPPTPTNSDSSVSLDPRDEAPSLSYGQDGRRPCCYY